MIFDNLAQNLPQQNDNNTQFQHKFDSIVDHYYSNVVKNDFPHLSKDFRNIEIMKNEYLNVCLNTGYYSLLEASGSGTYTTWYIYHCPKYRKLFLIWVNEKNSGCRDDIYRIHLL